MEVTAMDIQDIVEYMSEGTTRPAQEREKMLRYFNEKLSTEYVDSANPIEDLFYDVKTAPCIFSQEMDIKGPFRSYEDYKYNGNIIVHSEGLNKQGKTWTNPYLDNLRIEVCSSGLTRVTYESQNDWNNKTSFREDIYYKGSRLAELVKHDMTGLVKNEVLIYKNNPLASLYEAHIQKENDLLAENDIFPDDFIFDVNTKDNILKIRYSDEVIELPSTREIIEDFKEAYKRPGLDFDKSSLEPLTVYYEDKAVGKLNPDDISAAIDSMNQKNEKLLGHKTALLPYIDKQFLIENIIKDIANDASFSFKEIDELENNQQKSLKKCLDEITDLYIYSHVNDVYTNILPALEKNLNAGYDPDRAMRVDYLRECNTPLDMNDSYLSFNLVRNGINSLSTLLDDTLINGKTFDDFNNKVEEITDNFRLLEKRIAVMDLPETCKTEDEVAVRFLVGDKFMNANMDKLPDLVDDYKIMRDKILPALAMTKEQATELSSRDSSIETRHRIIRKYSDVFLKGKLALSTDFFKNPWDNACLSIKVRMKVDDKLDYYMKNGKEMTVSSTKNKGVSK